jgi:hypothetical protein
MDEFHLMYFGLPKTPCILFIFGLFYVSEFCKLFGTKWVIHIEKDADVCDIFICAI